MAGPAGAAVELIWERDELVFTETAGSKQHVSQAKRFIWSSITLAMMELLFPNVNVDETIVHLYNDAV